MVAENKDAGRTSVRRSVVLIVSIFVRVSIGFGVSIGILARPTVVVVVALVVVADDAHLTVRTVIIRVALVDFS